ncbi:MAG: RadC family protein [Vicinamibacterales bacterium]
MKGPAVVDRGLAEPRLLRSIAPADRPREKLVRAGAEALGDNELVAAILGSGTRSRGALTLGQDVLIAAGGVQGLARIGVDELCRIPGVGVPRAARLLAAVELGRRVLAPEKGNRLQILKPDDAGDYLMARYAGHRVERVGVMLLDLKRRVIRTAILSIGSLDNSMAHPREIFREAVAVSAAGVVVFHNHPSGDPTPSPHDRQVTHRLMEAGEVMGIPLMDHIILGDGRYFSFWKEART